MDRAEQFEDSLCRALKLAHFIHRDKAVAMNVVLSAVEKLEVAAQAQDKRLYYQPSGRTTARAARTKVSLSEKHLLQRLIYIESEPYEREREKQGSASEEDMITHFVKHLVKITLKRNSFYVSLGVSRLLHSYTTAETIGIYDFCVQDPDRTRDDYYYRSRKARLMREVKDRFGGLLAVSRSPRGEERFESQADSERHTDLVRRCLSAFTPWATACVIPASLNPATDTVRQLMFDSGDPDDEHGIEVNRIHSLIHPDCFSRLVRAMKYDPPESRLSVPNFSLTKGDGNSDRREPPDFGDDDVAVIKAKLNERAARRKVATAGWLRVVVDGTERTRLDLRRTTRAHFAIEEDAELIEVIGVDRHGDTLLAACFVNSDEESSTRRSIILEGGQEVTFDLSPSRDRYGDVEGIEVDLSYRETKATRAAALYIRQRLAAAAGWLNFGAGWSRATTRKPAIALALIALLAAGLWFFLPKGNQPSPPAQVVEEKPQTPAPVEDGKDIPTPESNRSSDQQQQAQNADPQDSPSPKQQDEKPKPRKLESPRSVVATLNPGRKRDRAIHNAPEPEEQDLISEPQTRGSPPAFVPLTEVKSIAVEVRNGEEAGRQILEKLNAALLSSRRFEITDREQSDALLKVSVRTDVAGVIYTVRLANSAGYVVFPTGRESVGRKYTGTPDEVAAKVLRDLLAEIERQKARK